MSNKIRHILSQHEVPPPAGAWQGIADELDLSDAMKPVGKKLAEAAITPPAQSWERILSGLEEDTLAKKLYHAEAVPPANAWNRIREELSDEKVIPLKQPSYQWLKYAAAAAVLAFVTWGALKLYSPDKTGSSLVAQNETVKPPATVTGSATAADVLNELVAGVHTANETEEARNDAALEASKKTVAKVDFNNRKMARVVSGFYFNSATAPGTRGIDTDLPIPDGSGQADRYFMLMTPEGNIIRVSKKLGGMVCCISGEAEDPACMDQLKKWREKIVSSSLGHSADNFMDLLLLVNAAGEEQQH